MKYLYYVFFIFFNFLIKNVDCASSTSHVWKVIDPITHTPCIQMEATINLNLSYIITGSEGVRYTKKLLPVPSHAEVNNAQSSCNTDVQIQDKTIKSQIITLDFVPGEQTGWSIQFLFTQNEIFHTTNTEFTLYGVEVTANYTYYKDDFPGYDINNPIVRYNQSFDFNSPEPSEIADAIYADIHYSYSCESEQEFPINKNESVGRTAYVHIKKLRVQAFAPNGTKKFGDRELCPQDQTGDDLVPVIVGSVLSALVLITLIIYLVYRARQPPSVLYLTNPTSHFEDLAVMKAKHDEENHDDDDLHGHHHNNHNDNHILYNRPIARHLEEQPISTIEVQYPYENAAYED